MPDSFGERAATEQEIQDWIELVRAGKQATRSRRFDAEKEETPLHHLQDPDE